MVRTVSDRLSKTLDGFVPQRLAESPHWAWRARNVALTSFLMSGVFAIMGVIRVAQSSPVALIDAALALVTFFGPFWMRRSGNVLTAVHSSAAVVMLLGFANILWIQGPGLNLASVGIASMPIGITLFGGTRAGGIWAAINGIGLSAVGLYALLQPSTPAPLGVLRDHIVLLTIDGALFLVGMMYERQRSASVDTLRTLEQRHRETELARIQAEADAGLAKAERFASMGRVAASVAHEINNPLAYVSNNLHFCRLKMEDGDPEIVQALDESVDGAKRIAGIVAELSKWARPSDDQVDIEPVLVDKPLRTALKMAEGHIRPRAHIVTHFDQECLALGDEPRLMQVFLNLLLNAAQAIPEGRASQHEIEVDVEEKDSQVMVTITDSGKGIPTELLEQVRKPFFTTKAPGEGTGIGLALCDNILKRLGGSLELESQPGRTVARVLLASATGDVRDSEAPQSSIRPGQADGARVLIVADEPLVTQGLKRLLPEAKVVIELSGAGALQRLRDGERFDLILCDLMMPDITGIEVDRCIREEFPQLVSRLAFTTGGGFTATAQTFLDSTDRVVLQKPVNPELLHQLVKALRAKRVSGM